MILDDEEKMKELDPEGMLEDLDTFPEQCAEALSIGADLDLPVDLTGLGRVIVTGMGGSAISGDLLARLLDLPVVSNRGYMLPRYVDSDDLLVAISYSGNTEETLSALEDGLSRGMDVICLSTGGLLEDFCFQRDLPMIKIPTGHQPRASTGYILFPLLEIFRRANFAGTLDTQSLIEALESMRDDWNSSVEVRHNKPKEIAKEFRDKIPIIYGTKFNTEAVAFRWKTQVNENAKQPAFWNVFPELNHNEIVGYELHNTLLDNAKVVLLRNDFDIERNVNRMEIMQEIFDAEKIDYEVVKAPRGDKYTGILGQVYFGDYFSVYLAMLNKVDPSPVRLIEDFKKKLKSYQN